MQDSLSTPSVCTRQPSTPVLKLRSYINHSENNFQTTPCRQFSQEVTPPHARAFCLGFTLLMAQSCVSYFFKSTKPKRVILSKMAEFAYVNGFSLTSELTVGWQAILPGNTGYSPDHQTDWTNTRIFLASISSLTSSSNSNLSSCPRPQGNSLWKTRNYKPTSSKISAPWIPCWPWKPGTNHSHSCLPSCPKLLSSFQHPIVSAPSSPFLFLFYPVTLYSYKDRNLAENKNIYLCVYIYKYMYIIVSTHSTSIFTCIITSLIFKFTHICMCMFILFPPLSLPIRNVC